MAAQVRVDMPSGGGVATFERGRWRAADHLIEETLNVFEEARQIAFIGHYDPTPEHSAAEAAVREYGGEVLHVDPVEPVDAEFIP